jgi:hypothetical protein
MIIFVTYVGIREGSESPVTKQSLGKEMDMKRLFFCGIMIVMLSCLLRMNAGAQMYWDQTDPEEDSAATEDVSTQVDRDKRIIGSSATRMYDNSEVPTIEPEPLLQAVAAPMRPRSEDVSPQPQTDEPSRNRTDSPSRSSVNVPSTAVTSPRPAVTDPGGSQEARRPGQVGKPEIQAVESKRSAPSSTSEEQPVTKKMKWGQAEVKPSESKTKLQWGEQKTDGQ